MIQIGTEGGFLPAPVVIRNQPVNYTYNRRDIVVLNVQEKALFLGPAERADVIVDFSQFAGKTLILYNDAPAPVPAADPRIDYYTGDPDQTDTGGAPPTLPGYGPNTRTDHADPGRDRRRLERARRRLQRRRSWRAERDPAGRLRRVPGPDRRAAGRLQRGVYRLVARRPSDVPAAYVEDLRTRR